MYRKLLNTIPAEAGPLSWSAAAVLAALITCQSVIIPQAIQLRGRLTGISEVRTLTDAGKNRNVLEKQLSSVQKKLAEKRMVLTGGMAENGDVSTVLQMLIDKARSADIRFVRMQPLPVKQDGSLALFPVVLEMTTEFSSLEKLTAQLETVPHLVRIERCGISNRSDRRVSVTLLVSCFLQNPGAQP